MRVLLIGEASGVHHNLAAGLKTLGVDCTHVTHASAQNFRKFKEAFSSSRSGALGGLSRNLSPFLKLAKLGRFDVVNFANALSTIRGRFTRYRDLPLIRGRTRLMAYYALSCDEVGLIRRNPLLPYRPCETCLASGEILGRDCEREFNPAFERSQERVREYFDFGASSMVEYGHVEELFGKRFARIPLPVDIDSIPFVPAQPRDKPKVVHAPSRRGFKGTDVVLQALERLKRDRNDFEFRLIEGLPYDEYAREMLDADIVVDQVHSQSPGMSALESLAAGKVVLSGSTLLGRSYFPFSQSSPVLDAHPEPARLAALLGSILDTKDRFGDLAAKGRSYICDFHDKNLVAQQFLSAWSAQLERTATS